MFEECVVLWVAEFAALWLFSRHILLFPESCAGVEVTESRGGMLCGKEREGKQKIEQGIGRLCVAVGCSGLQWVAVGCSGL